MTEATDICVRRAQREDVAALAALLARAFESEPFHQWLLAPGSDRASRSQRLFRTELRNTLRDGVVYTTERLEGASLWGHPDSPGGSMRSQLAVVWTLTRLLGWRLRRTLAQLAVVAEIRPAEAYWYLSVIGTDPRHQGQGVASALLSHALAECDASGVGAWLETASTDRTAFYRRFGFVERGRVRLAHGPEIVGMWRRAQMA